MLANNVQETTTTTGTGNIALAGASENGRTFTSQFATNDRFTYFIDDESGEFETGIGYLSGAATLVREVPTDGSASLPVNLSAGTKQVFVAPSATVTGPTAYHGMKGALNGPWVASGTMTAPYSGGNTLTANRQHYFSMEVNWSSDIDGFVLLCDTSVGSSSNSVLLGIYQRLPDGDIGPLIIQADSKFDPSITTDQIISCTQTSLPPGRYYGSLWSDVAVRPRCPTQTQSQYPGLGWTANNGNVYTYVFGSVSSLSSLPTTPTAPTSGSNNARPPAFRLRTVD